MRMMTKRDVTIVETRRSSVKTRKINLPRTATLPLNDRDEDGWILRSFRTSQSSRFTPPFEPRFSLPQFRGDKPVEFGKLLAPRFDQIYRPDGTRTSGLNARFKRASLAYEPTATTATTTTTTATTTRRSWNSNSFEPVDKLASRYYTSRRMIRA